jgi:hypothetical protein
VSATTLAEAVRNALVADPNVTSRLAAWDFGTGGGAPAVFTTDPAPEACGAPLVVVTDTGGQRSGVRGHRGADVTAQVRIWADKGESAAALRDLGVAVWHCLDRATLAVDGYRTHNVGCLPPQQLTDADGFPGMVLDVQASLLEL